MAKTRQQKEQEVKDLTDKLAEAKGVVFSSYQGLSVSQTEQLRRDLRAEGAELKMAKKNLLQLALAGQELDKDMVKDFTGSVCIAFGYQDEVAPARVVKKFADSNEVVEVFGGILEHQFIAASEVKSLASLPTRDELFAKVAGTINAPVSGFVNVLAGTMRSFVYALQAIQGAKH